MNIHDLCPEGREKYTEWQVLNNLIQKIDSLQVRQIIARDERIAWRAYQKHIRDCELRRGQDE